MELWTVAEAAVYLKLNPDYLRRRTKAGAVPALRMGRVWRYRKDRLDAWLDAGCPSQKAQPGLFDDAGEAE